MYIKVKRPNFQVSEANSDTYVIMGGTMTHSASAGCAVHWIPFTNTNN